MQEPTVVESEPAIQATAHVVHVLMQFALAVRYRKNVMIAALLVSGLLGGLYYATATRFYAAKASLLVMQAGNDVMDPSVVPQNGAQQASMETFERVIVSDKVVRGALKYIPPEDRIDMAGVPEEKWHGALQRQLFADSIHYTNIIEVEYRSKDPGAAVSVVNAIVQSYLDFMDKTHKGTAGEIIDVLKREKVELAEKLDIKEAQLQQARGEAGTLGSGPENKLIHPMMQRVIAFNEALVETQKQRVEMEATLAAIESAIRNGEGLQQHVMTVANMVGREILLNSLAINDHDAATQVSLERDLLAYRAQLQAMEEYLGPRHPDVVAMQEKIWQTQQ